MLSAILGISGCPGRDWIHTLHLDHYYAVTPWDQESYLTDPIRSVPFILLRCNLIQGQAGLQRFQRVP